jgi:D-aminoacyl-tRNA deacylase
MKILVQRVSEARVEVDGEIVGSIGPGVLAFVGVTQNDTEQHVAWLANKLLHLRLFEDEQGKINRSLMETQKEILIVSQFTLYADCHQGRRPSFTQAASPEQANQLYMKLIEEVKRSGLKVHSGVFGAYMKVFLVNEGPFTLLLERS